MCNDLSFDLHTLTGRLDRSADRILRAECDVSYRRFRALLIVGELGAATQRGLAEALGVSEPSVSRMTGVLAETGLLEVQADPAGGNRRRLCLTVSGKHLVERCRDLLERRFVDLVNRSGVPYRDYARHTQLLIAALEASAGSTAREDEPIMSDQIQARRLSRIEGPTRPDARGDSCQPPDKS
ncbi:MAG: MarR family transcriptional regulator [Pseudonocardiales bacterium]|nr:MarR family transcriptional regulator [Pseudonocardiales bacterium]